jgi:hypothetical protein
VHDRPRASLDCELSMTTTTCKAGERISQLRKRITAAAVSHAIEHTAWRMRVHDILGFFSISFGQQGYNNGHALSRSHNISKAWPTPV